MTELTDVVLDFETYYDSDYTLTKLTNMEYVLDPRFEAIGFALKYGQDDSQWFHGDFEQLRRYLLEVDWAKCRLVAHHAMFDASVLEWHFNIPTAAKFLCTAVGSRPYVFPYIGRMALGPVAEFLEVGKKGDEVLRHAGRHYVDFTPEQLVSYGEYSCNDVELTARIKRALCAWLPNDEQDLIDLTLKKYLRPKFVLDSNAIADERKNLAADHAAILAKIGALGLNEEHIRSRIQFTKALEIRGISPPTKKSKTTGKVTYAYAKDDEDFVALLTHDNPEVRLLAEARGKLSSTLEMARLERFQRVWDLDLFGEHLMPIPLMYYAAHPGRFGGAEKLNLQNLPRPDKKNPRKAALRRSLRAPEGYSVLTADFSNIEARIVATLAGQWDLVAAFANGVDIYSQFASRIYGREIIKGRDDVERFVGKTCILGLGYGMGWERFLKAMSMAKVKMDAKEADRIVHLYRDTYSAIPDLWRSLEAQTRNCVSQKAMFSWGPFMFAHERIILPNNMPIIYPGLRFDKTSMTSGLLFDSRRKGKTPKVSHLWGGIVAENVTQALARIIATRAELRIARAGLPAAHQAHDELIWLVRTEWLDKVKPGIERAMCDPVPFLPSLPIAVEIHHGATYGDCK